ncbi:MAG: DinB family protein [Chloroflexota bacterium]
MNPLGAPFTQKELIDSYQMESKWVHDFFSQIQLADFFASSKDVWTPADNLDHLIRSCSPVILGLGLPKLALRMRFGLAKHQSRTLAVVRHEYTNVALAQGGKAGGPYLPDIGEETAETKRNLLSKWQYKSEQFVQKVGEWSESDLDKYAVDHPLLGQMTIREIIFFTLYHNMHHVNDVSRLLQQPEVEWFDRE